MIGSLRRAAPPIAAVLMLAGCGGGATDVGPPVVTAGCRDAVADAASESDPAVAHDLLLVTLEYCINVNEWETALIERPAARSAMRLPGGVDTADLVKIVCRGSEATAMCRDATD